MSDLTSSLTQSLSSSSSDTLPSPSLKTTKGKKRQKDPATQFLQSQLAPFKDKLRQAMLLDVLSVFLLMVQMFFLAKIMASVLEKIVSAGVWQMVSLANDFLSVLVIALCLFLRPVLMFWRDKWLSDVGVNIAADVRRRAMTSLGVLGMDKNRLGADGALASFITHEPDALQGYGRFYVQKITAVMTPLLIAAVVATKSLMASVVLVATAPLLPVFMALIGAKTAQKNRQQLDALADLGGRFLDWLRGMGTLVRLQATKTAGADIAQASKAYKECTMSVLKIAFLNSAVLEFFAALSIALVAVYLGFGLLGELPFYQGHMPISYDVALFVLLLVPEFYAPLRRLGAEYHVKGAAEGAAKVLMPLLAVQKNQKHAQAVTMLPDDWVNDEAESVLALEQVAVVDSGRVRLAPVSLVLKFGEKWALVGASGSGKSTLLALLLGFVPYTGRALLWGNSIGEVEMTLLRAQIGYLPQMPALLPMSIADNLRLANPAASDDELRSVLQQVGLWQLVQALPDGLLTVLGERGGGLSGGQGQRLAIAQLLLQNAKIWLLDEPTEHLDKQTKTDICQLLHQLAVDKTVLWATHDTDLAWADGVCDLGRVDE